MKLPTYNVTLTTENIGVLRKMLIAHKLKIHNIAVLTKGDFDYKVTEKMIRYCDRLLKCKEESHPVVFNQDEFGIIFEAYVSYRRWLIAAWDASPFAKQTPDTYQAFHVCGYILSELNIL